MWHHVQTRALSIFHLCTLIGAVSENLDIIHAHTKELEISFSSLNDIVRRPDTAGFLAHDYHARGLCLWNKTGNTSRVRTDIGALSTSESREASAVLSNWERDSDHRDAATETMCNVGVLLRWHVQGCV